ncbi:UNVERIFIED_CONTAM: hypothetical protein FKN15_011892 [Acipenser sinensis]
MNGTQRPQSDASHGDEDTQKQKLKFTNMELEILVYTLRCLNNALGAIQTTSMAKFHACKSCTTSPSTAEPTRRWEPLSWQQTQALTLTLTTSSAGSANNAGPGADPACTGGHSRRGP